MSKRRKTRVLYGHAMRQRIRSEVVSTMKRSGIQKIGGGLPLGTTLEPLANTRRVPAIDRIVANARESGAKVATGGERVGTQDNFFAPTVLTDVPLDASVFNDEPFGPIAAIRVSDALDLVIGGTQMLPEEHGLRFPSGSHCVDVWIPDPQKEPRKHLPKARVLPLARDHPERLDPTQMCANLDSALCDASSQKVFIRLSSPLPLRLAVRIA
ncbi:aldehyde dehydrogenase family protein [Paraburkholderia panacisoli]